MDRVNIEITCMPEGGVVRKQEDLLKGIQADLFCWQEELFQMHPCLKSQVELKYADVAVVASGEAAVVRVFGVDRPYELGLSVNDAIFSYVWRIHPDEKYGWYPDIPYDYTKEWIAKDILPNIFADLRDQELRHSGTFVQRVQGQRSYIAYGQMRDRAQAYEHMLFLLSAAQYIEEVSK